MADVCDYLSEVLVEQGVKISPETVRSNFMLYPLYSAIVTPDTIRGYQER
jgi:hypothetical protein